MLKTGAQHFYYGNDADCKVCITHLHESPKLSFTCKINGEEVQVNTQLIGSYNLENVLAAISIGSYFGIQPPLIADAISTYIPENNRSQMVVSDQNKILFDAYNANPTSMKAALENFVALQEDNKVVMLGEMKELGNDSTQEHTEILNFLRSNQFAKVYLVGKNYKALINKNDEFIWMENVEALIKEITTSHIRDAFILVKGSRSNKLEQLKGIL